MRFTLKAASQVEIGRLGVSWITAALRVSDLVASAMPRSEGVGSTSCALAERHLQLLQMPLTMSTVGVRQKQAMHCC